VPEPQVALLAIETYKEAFEPVRFVTTILFILFTEFAAGVNPVRAVDPLCVQFVCPAVVTDGKTYAVFPRMSVTLIRLGFAIFYPPNTIEIIKVLPVLPPPVPLYPEMPEKPDMPLPEYPDPPENPEMPENPLVPVDPLIPE
jgi:hypothetical protein